jgi:hypothetical protein
MRRFWVLFVTALAGASSVYANLGEDGDRIDDSYGNLVQRHLRDDGTIDVLYHKDRYLYFVIFDNGKSVLERYSHANGSKLSEKEIARFLKANSGGATWTPDSRSTERRFNRSDAEAEAMYGNVDGHPTLTVRKVSTKG